MNPPADVIRQLLVDEGIGSDNGAWPIYVAHFPDKPHEAIVVYDTPGRRDGRIMRTGEMIGHPGIQIQLRSPSYLALWEKVQAIIEVLDAVNQTSVVVSSEGSYTVQNVSRSGPPIPMGMDDVGDRHHFAINATVTMRESE